MSKRILRLPKVIAHTGLARSTIYLKIEHGSFPRPVSLGDRSVGWIDADIDRWIETVEKRGWQKSRSPRWPRR